MNALLFATGCICNAIMGILAFDSLVNTAELAGTTAPLWIPLGLYYTSCGILAYFAYKAENK